jgi:hypothetical protein
MLPILRIVNSQSGIFGYALFNTTPLARNTFLGNVYGEILTRSLLASRKHAATKAFILDYRHHNLCIDLTWSSNQFCHLSHSCNPNARLELWRINKQPTWKVFTNCDISPNHFITIDFRTHNLPRVCPCLCDAPTCVSTQTTTTTICDHTNRTHPIRTQTSIDNYFTPTTATSITSHPVVHTRAPSPPLSQSRLFRYYQRTAPSASGHTSLVIDTRSSPTSPDTTPARTLEAEASQSAAPNKQTPHPRTPHQPYFNQRPHPPGTPPRTRRH